MNEKNNNSASWGCDCSSDLPPFSVTECGPPIRSWEDGRINETFSASLKQAFATGTSRKILKLINKQYKITTISFAGEGFFNEYGKHFEPVEALRLNLRYKYKIEYMHPEVYELKPISHGRHIKRSVVFIKCF